MATPLKSKAIESEVDNDLKMPFVDHLEELRQRILKSIISIVASAVLSLIFVKPLVRLLEAPAGSIRFLQLAPGEFLFVSVKVAGYSGLTIALPYLIFQLLGFILPGLTKPEKKLIAPAVAGSAILFIAGIFFAWWALIPAALKFLVSYGADVVEPLWSIERYLDFVLLLMVGTGLAFQLPILQLLLGIFGLINWKQMIGAWRWVLMGSAVAGAVLTPSTDPITMLLLAGSITALFFVGVLLVLLSTQFRERIPSKPPFPPSASN
ncbi:twin-arginine translocase subunit TatC [Prochlorococcus marinus]|uniref:Sec-independent protein translocase protein TatC n=1 Tax=Prochlorococcus marinus (strain MIT 9211) TaxID=93059 RepID=A9BE85_PROM4|nr:twin-arginine translocase subunit TatC [Prochlorococcus marinus]ABX08395.1 protein secretion component, Tat family [Prochlorococcus marinus str. MIT 9211]